MAHEDAVRLLEERPRVFWGKVIRVLIERGWTPPPPDERIVDDLLANMEEWGAPTPQEEPRVEELRLLTPAEVRVAQLVAMGLSNQAVAEQLGLAETTVKFHLTNTFRKTGFTTRTQLTSAILRARE